jgi:hypothetical protein
VLTETRASTLDGVLCAWLYMACDDPLAVFKGMANDTASMMFSSCHMRLLTTPYLMDEYEQEKFIKEMANNESNSASQELSSQCPSAWGANVNDQDIETDPHSTTELSATCVGFSH